jgi:RNA polymerase sigma-70 factor (ECF subfamily)
MATAPADLALARRLIAGDQSAFEQFFADYFPRVYRFARVRLEGRDDAAEEVVQTTLIKALAKIHTYRGEAALLTWLCTFCRHEVAAWHARTGRTSEVALENTGPDGRAVLDALALLAQDDPERALDRSQLCALVHATLDHLPPRYGDALEWKYIEGLSVEEIAGRFDMGYKAAESLLSRARQAFREGFSALATPRLSNVMADSDLRRADG